jgi:excisionase family DNA binding protein
VSVSRTCQPALLVGAGTIKTGISLVKEIIARPHIFTEWYTCIVKLISTTEAAKRLNVTPSRVRAMIKAKRLKAIRIGIMWLIDPKDLEGVKDRKVGRPRKARKSTQR